jgi:hypothetical protein
MQASQGEVDQELLNRAERTLARMEKRLGQLAKEKDTTKEVRGGEVWRCGREVCGGEGAWMMDGG